MSVNEETTRKLKAAMVEAMRATFGIINQAAQQVGIHRTTHYTWMSSDPEYAATINEYKEVKKDFIESKLIKLINEGDTAATIFAAKTQLKDRGYIERTEYSGPGGNPIETTIKIIRDTSTGIAPGEFTPESKAGTSAE
jgi:hypothetical protein